LRRQGATVEVRVDPKRRARYERLVLEMDRASRREAAGFDAFWEAVGEILDAELYVTGGYDTPKAFIQQEVKEKLRTAQRNVRVAEHSSPREQEKYGMTLLDAAIGWMLARTGKPLGKKLPMKFGQVRIDVKRNGKSVKVGLGDATVEEVQAATAKLLGKTGRKAARLSDVERVLADVMKTEKVLGDLTVSVTGGVARFVGVPLAALDTFLDALKNAEAKLASVPATAEKAPAKKRKTVAKQARSTK
jgi:hypothetical protein